MTYPEHKYMNDVSYKRLVDTFESLIARAEFTPSEIREAAVFACIRHEARKPLRQITVPKGMLVIGMDYGMSTQDFSATVKFENGKVKEVVKHD